MYNSANMMLTRDELQLAIRVLGGPRAASAMLGCSDTLVRHWLKGRRLISAEKAWRLHELIKTLTGTLPGVAFNLKIAAQEGEARLMRWRAQRPRWQPARGDKPRLSAFERSEHRWRDREIARRLACGESVKVLAREYEVLPRTIERWARRGSQQGTARKREVD
jgi:DNA-binding NarL/FixJ family response regulator